MKDEPGAPPQRRSRLAKLLAILFFLVVAMAIPEVGAWFFITRVAKKDAPRGRSEKILDAYREYKLAPDYSKEGRVTNAQGFRRHEDVHLEKPDGTYRIFLMGGSGAFGAAAMTPFPRYLISNEDTIAYKLEESLNSQVRELRFEVINAAVGGYKTHHHLVYLNQTLLDYDPDMVLFMDGTNDHYRLSPEFRSFTPIMHQTESVNDPSLGFVGGTAIHYLARRSWFFHGLWIAHGRWKSWNKPRPVPRAEGNLADYESVAHRTFLKMIKRNVMILKDEGVIPIVFLQPELVLQPDSTMSPEEKELLAIDLPLHPPDYRRQMEGMYAQLVPMLTDWSEQYEFEFHDLNPLFHAVDEQCLIDFAHVSPNGSQVIADFMREKILARLAREGVSRDGGS